MTDTFRRHGLLTPAGIVVPMGRTRPKLDADERDGEWKILTFSIRKKRKSARETADG
jgi:hypothetical protein